MKLLFLISGILPMLSLHFWHSFQLTGPPNWILLLIWWIILSLFPPDPFGEDLHLIFKITYSYSFFPVFPKVLIFFPSFFHSDSLSTFFITSLSCTFHPTFCTFLSNFVFILCHSGSISHALQLVFCFFLPSCFSLQYKSLEFVSVP